MRNIKGIAKTLLLCVFTTYIVSFWYPVNKAQAIEVQQGWVQENGKWYYYDETTGYKKSGWIKDNSKWYFLEDNGAMKTGWLSWNNKCYYFYQDGSMAVNTIIDSCTIGIDGALIDNVNSESIEKIRQKWEGNWNRLGDNIHSSSNITISDVKQTSFNFALSAFDGANTGNLEGTAIINGNTAIYTNDEWSFNISFTISNEELEVKPGGSFYGVVGNGVTIDGKYKKDPQKKKVPTLVDMKVFKTQEQEEIFKQLVKDDYKLFIDYFHLVSEEKDLDDFGAKVYSGGIRGLFTYCEGIVMSNGNKIWAALLNENQIKYYTNSTETNKLPKTIDNWRSRFKDAKVIYINNITSKNSAQETSQGDKKLKGEDNKLEANSRKKDYVGIWRVHEAFTINPSKDTRDNINVNAEIECKDIENTIIVKNKNNVIVAHYKENLLEDGDITLTISETQEFYYAINKDLLSMITDIGEGNFEVLILERVK